MSADLVRLTGDLGIVAYEFKQGAFDGESWSTLRRLAEEAREVADLAEAATLDAASREEAQ